MASTVAWPLIAYDPDADSWGQAVCVAHRGQHIFYLDGCVAFEAGRQPKRLRVALTRQDRPEPVVAEPSAASIDVAALSDGIASALQRLMEEWYSQRQEWAPGPAPEPPRPEREQSRSSREVDALGTRSVWGDDDGE